MFISKMLLLTWHSNVQVVRLLAGLITFCLATAIAAQDDNLYQEFTLELKGDYRFYFKEGEYTGQEQHFPSLAIEPEYFLEWADGNQSLNFRGYLRLDRDDQRTHWDIRELYWQYVKNDWELSLGAKKIYWGVTESAHLVDIINQTDLVESFDGEQKFGQPMAHLSLVTGAGIFDFFAMTYFRRRIFPGEKGRLRFPILLKPDDIPYESDLELWHPDLAMRWSNTIGVIDYGLSYFYGTGREPYFEFDQSTGGLFALYPINHQIGLDLQATTGPWLWKWESIFRTNDFQDMFAMAAGFEFTFSNVKDSGLDIGILSEYLYDNREELAVSGFDNDLFVGSRLAFNDVQSTQILFGGIFDLGRSSKFFSIEGSRRIGESWKIELEARILSDIDPEEFSYFIRNDSFLQLRILKFF